jgi:tetratricopeptide (TPR) repeat protein
LGREVAVSSILLSVALFGLVQGSEPTIKDAASGHVTEATPHYDLELLYDQGKMDEGLQAAKSLLAQDPDDLDLYWHVARFMFEVGERFERTDKSINKVAYYEEMIAVLEKGLQKDPSNAHLLFGYGIAKGRLGTTRGVLSSLFMAKDVESAWLKAGKSDYTYASLSGQEQLPCDVWLCLGIFYRLVPDSFIVEMLGGTRGSLDKSLANLERANACSPNRILLMKELAATQLCVGEKKNDDAMLQAGRATLLKARSLPVDSATDQTDHRHVEMLLADTKLGCGYSRVGQQDLDEEKLEAQAPSASR